MSKTNTDNLVFFSECTAEEQTAILESARIALQDEDVLSLMDLSAEFAIPLGDRLVGFLGEPPRPEGFKIAEPKISVSSGKLAVFDGWNIVRDFRPYLNREKAIADARVWIKQYSDVEPEVVHPHVTKVTMSSGRRR